jgi:hypothetical protein
MAVTRKLWFGQQLGTFGADPTALYPGLTASMVLNDSSVTGSNVSAALSYLSTLIAGTGVVPSGVVATNNVALWADNTGTAIKAGPSIGTAANNLLQLDGSGNLPAINGQNLTGLRFTQLADAPSSYAGQTLKAVRVNAAETALEFFTLGGGTGDVVGPASSTANALAVFNGTTGKLIKDGAAPGAAGGYVRSDGTSWVRVSGLAWTDVTGAPTTLAGYGITDAVPVTRTLTINGSAQDLSANRTWTVGDVLTSGSYADPSWITSLAYAKITGAPTPGSATFIGLTDVPATYVGQAGKLVRVNATPNALEFIDLSTLSIAWGQLTGTPTTIAGYGITDFNTLGDARYVQLSSFLSAALSADFDTASTTYVDVTGLSVALAANSRYTITVIGSWTSSSNSGQATFGLNLPAGATFTMTRFMGITSSAVSTTMQNTVNQAANVAIGTATAARSLYMVIQVTTSATAGVAQVRLASNNAAYTATCRKDTRIKAESY